MTGGKTTFEQKLDSMFNMDPLPEDKLPIFSTGMIGQYAHGNEPSHHVAYLYNYIDRPDKTQKLVREILTTQYKNRPDGHCGNEDCGQMSSWYVFSCLGFYPVNPAQGIYVLGSPLVKEAILQLENGNSFQIKTVNQSKDNFYIRKIELNGKDLHRYYVSHQEIMAGGTLTFYMDNKPKENLITNMIPSSHLED
jgi:predicted alpha-1,2-mannosidase